MSGQIEDGAKLFASAEGGKLHGGENNPVYNNCRLTVLQCFQKFYMLTSTIYRNYS